MKNKEKSLILLSLLPLILAGLLVNYFNPEIHNEKINGVNFVAPPKEIGLTEISEIKRINSNWIAITPYAFSHPNEPFVNHSYKHQWWGETPDGIKKTISLAKQLKLKVMLKPHVWVRGDGWAGDFELRTDNAWNLWYNDYKEYILTYAKIAEEYNVEILCIGTEYRIAATKKNSLWVKLIKEIRNNYSGKLTYAANWDNYKNIRFWNQLDYIGIDSYFPINTQKTPTKDSLVKNWQGLKYELKEYSIKYGKPILFTEYGYESRDYTADGHWKYNVDTLDVNLEGQVEAYKAIYEVFWDEAWFSGGFLWKWYAKHQLVGENKYKSFTPQNKPVEEIISKQYKK